MKVKHICFISEGYPTEDDPFFTFVRQLVVAITDQGVKCSVIAPQSMAKNLIRKSKQRPEYWIDTTDSGNTIDIYQPKYISFSTLKIKDTNISHLFFEKAAMKAFFKYKIKADVLYGHFWHSGMIAAKLASKTKLPAIVASGEAEILIDDYYSRKTIDTYLPFIKGAICVSTKNFEESLEHHLIHKDRMVVIPNAIDSTKFYQKDRKLAREELKLPQELFIVAFTGSFIHRKGCLRVLDSINQLDDVYALFIGSGPEEPVGEKILFKGILPHEQVNTYLNAANVFVLPTLAEGCCNAIIEAEACGLPIISSDKSFNDDILTEFNSIRVDSMDVDEIAEAIMRIKNNPARAHGMEQASLHISEALRIEKRATKVINTINLLVR